MASGWFAPDSKEKGEKEKREKSKEKRGERAACWLRVFLRDLRASVRRICEEIPNVELASRWRVGQSIPEKSHHLKLFSGTKKVVKQ